jgi:transposase
MTNHPTRAVYYYFRRWQKRGLWEQINQVLREQIRIKQGKFPQATAAIIDSHSGLNDGKKGQVYGFDGGKAR